jgi:hypothetical protein
MTSVNETRKHPGSRPGSRDKFLKPACPAGLLMAPEVSVLLADRYGLNTIFKSAGPFQGKKASRLL